MLTAQRARAPSQWFLDMRHSPRAPRVAFNVNPKQHGVQQESRKIAVSRTYFIAGALQEVTQTQVEMATLHTDPTERTPQPPDECGVRPRVLIVADDLRTLRIFRRVLRQIDERCMTLAQGRDVFTVLREYPTIEVLIWDQHLPDVDATQVIRQIREHCGESRPIQFVLVSDHPETDTDTDMDAEQSSPIAARDLDSIDFLSKPVMPRDLLASVHQAMLRTQLIKAVSEDGAQDDPTSATVVSKLALLSTNPSSTLDGALPAAAAPRVCLPHYVQEFDSLRFLKCLHEVRLRLFGESLLPDPTWCMLAELMRAALTGRRVAVTTLCAASKVPFTTALRRIDDLIAAGLAARTRDPDDRRRSYIRLTQSGRQKMQRYLRNVASSLARASNVSVRQAQRVDP